MKTEYDQIAAYEGQQIASAAKRILHDDDFNRWFRRTTGRRLPAAAKFLAVGALRVIPNPLRFLDYKLTLQFLNTIIRKSTDGVELVCSTRPDGSRFFMTNHRDIILDAAFLSKELREKYDIRPYLGVGNNLFGKPWIEDLMRINRCFAVIRNGGPREVVHNAQVLSDYIAHIRHKGESFWMAQREGRAKDSNDTTQPSVLKMLTLASEDSLISALQELRITPVSITYEYDPCDYLKAREMQAKRDNPAYKKTAKEDMLNMQTGLNGQKGHISLVVTECINSELETLRNATRMSEEGTLVPLSKNEILREAAAIIDRHIHLGYKLAWTNIAAMNILDGQSEPEMEKYIQSRIDKIQIEHPDTTFLRECLLEMYANPAINQRKALAAAEKQTAL